MSLDMASIPPGSRHKSRTKELLMSEDGLSVNLLVPSHWFCANEYHANVRLGMNQYPCSKRSRIRVVDRHLSSW